MPNLNNTFSPSSCQRVTINQTTIKLAERAFSRFLGFMIKILSMTSIYYLLMNFPYQQLMLTTICVDPKKSYPYGRYLFWWTILLKLHLFPNNIILRYPTFYLVSFNTWKTKLTQNLYMEWMEWLQITIFIHNLQPIPKIYSANCLANFAMFYWNR